MTGSYLQTPVLPEEYYERLMCVYEKAIELGLSREV